MPTLNHLTCTVTLPPTNTPLPTYSPLYLDSSVSAYLPVPHIPILHAAPSFNIHVRSSPNIWIAPGIAVFVFIDGKYQCNRSKPAGGEGEGVGVELRLRQREEKVFHGGRGEGERGVFVGREWRWVELDVDKANESSDMSDEQRDSLGTIEVVVLRCDYDKVEARGASRAAPAPASVRKASVKASSAKAPSAKTPSAKATSAKAPSAKAPSSKAPSGNAGSLGGLMGLFDGAMDFGLDGSGDSKSADRGNENWSQSDSSTSTCSHKHSRTGSGKSTTDSSDQQAGNQTKFPRMDGQDYDHPGVVVNQYGQSYDPRAPYTGYRPSPANYNAPPPQMYQVPSSAPQGHAPQGGPGLAPQGQPFVGPQPAFIPAYPSQQPQVPQGPQHFGPQYAPNPQVQPYPGQSGQNGPSYAYPTYVNQARGSQYVPQAPPGQPIPIQQQPPPPPQHHPMAGLALVDLGYQRFQIFRAGRRYSELFKTDYKLLAAAVPHILLLRNVLIDDLNLSQIEQVRRELRSYVAAGFFPNGEKVRPLEEPFASGKGSGGTSKSKRDRKSSSSRKDKNESGSQAGGGWGNEDGNDKAKSASQHSSSIGSSVNHFDSGSKKDGNGGWGDDNNENQNENQNDNSGGTGWGNTGNNDGDQNQTPGWDNSNQNNTNNGSPWGNDPPAQDTTWSAPAAAAPKPPSSHHSRASTAQKTTNPHAHIKPYFSNWRGTAPSQSAQQTKRPRPQLREPYTYPAGPTPHLPASQLGDRSHGVRPGRGADYTHNTLRPRYLDSMDEPFAVFVFNYRSVEKLEEILGRDMRGDLRAVAEEVGRGVLMGLPRERLVEEMLRMQEGGGAVGTGGEGGESGGADAAPAAAPAAASEDNIWGDNNAAQNDGGNEGRKSARQSEAGKNKVADNTAWSTSGQQNAWANPNATSNSKPDNAGWQFEGQGQTKPASQGFKPVDTQNAPAKGW